MSKNVWLLCCFFGLLASCQSKVVPLSERNIDGIAKPGTPFVHGRLPQQKKPDLFVQDKSLSIEEVKQPSETGSLYNIDDQRNYLFLTTLPVSVGNTVSVKVVSKAPQKKADAPADSPKDAKEPDSKNDDAVVKEMLAQLPQLDAGESNPPLLSSLKMRVEKVYDNGDALVVMNRSSKNASDNKDVFVKARVPYSAFQSASGVTTNDLTDVRWTDTLDGQLTERSSPNWEDEYSLRLSGFSEVKSLFAKQLEEKNKQLKGVRDRLNNQLVSFGKERQKLAVEREAAMKAKAEAETKASEAQQLLSDQKSELDDLKQKEKDREDAAASEEAAANGDGAAAKDKKPAATAPKTAKAAPKPAATAKK